MSLRGMRAVSVIIFSLETVFELRASLIFGIYFGQFSIQNLAQKNPKIGRSLIRRHAKCASKSDDQATKLQIRNKRT